MVEDWNDGMRVAITRQRSSGIRFCVTKLFKVLMQNPNPPTFQQKIPYKHAT